MLVPDVPLEIERLTPVPADGRRLVSARALLLGHRIDRTGLEGRALLSSVPTAFKVGDAGYVAVFRYGVVVMVNLTPGEERESLDDMRSRVSGTNARAEEEIAQLELTRDKEDRVPRREYRAEKLLTRSASARRRRPGKECRSGPR